MALADAVTLDMSYRDTGLWIIHARALDILTGDSNAWSEESWRLLRKELTRLRVLFPHNHDELDQWEKVLRTLDGAKLGAYCTEATEEAVRRRRVSPLPILVDDLPSVHLVVDLASRRKSRGTWKPPTFTWVNSPSATSGTITITSAAVGGVTNSTTVNFVSNNSGTIVSAPPVSAPPQLAASNALKALRNRLKSNKLQGNS